MNETEQEAEYQRAEATTKAANGRAISPDRPDTDEVRITLDWTPSITDARIVFHISVVRRGIQSSPDCEIDLARLDPLQIERLHSFLSARHAGITSAVDITKAVVWLLDVSLHQQSPSLNLHERQAKVRELLLWAHEQKKSG